MFDPPRGTGRTAGEGTYNMTCGETHLPPLEHLVLSADSQLFAQDLQRARWVRARKEGDDFTYVLLYQILRMSFVNTCCTLLSVRLRQSFLVLTGQAKCLRGTSAFKQLFLTCNTHTY